MMATLHVIICLRISNYQILLAYSIQSLMYSLMFSTPLLSGLVSHMTFSLDNFLMIGSACCNSTVLDIAYLEIGIHFPMNSSCNLLYCHNFVCCGSAFPILLFA